MHPRHVAGLGDGTSGCVHPQSQRLRCHSIRAMPAKYWLFPASRRSDRHDRYNRHNISTVHGLPHTRLLHPPTYLVCMQQPHNKSCAFGWSRHCTGWKTRRLPAANGMATAANLTHASAHTWPFIVPKRTPAPSPRYTLSWISLPVAPHRSPPRSSDTPRCWTSSAAVTRCDSRAHPSTRPQLGMTVYWRSAP